MNLFYLFQKNIYNDNGGYYVIVKGGSRTNSGAVYLTQIDLEFPINDIPLYSWEDINYDQDLSRFKNNLI